MSLQPVASQGRALIEKATKLGVPMDDLLTADGEEVAWTALKDFKATINGVLVEFCKGDPIRERPDQRTAKWPMSGCLAGIHIVATRYDGTAHQDINRNGDA